MEPESPQKITIANDKPRAVATDKSVTASERSIAIGGSSDQAVIINGDDNIVNIYSEGTVLKSSDANNLDFALLLEGVFYKSGKPCLAFTITNSSQYILVVSDISITLAYFKLIKPSGSVLYSGVQRTKLLVDLVKAGKVLNESNQIADVPYSDFTQIKEVDHGRPGFTSQFEMAMVNRSVSLLDPDMAIHIYPRSAELFLLNLQGQVDSPEELGFVSFFSVKVCWGISDQHISSSIIANCLFEVSCTPPTSKLEVRLHPIELFQVMSDLFLHPSEMCPSSETVISLVKNFENQDFSDGFLYDFAYRVNNSCNDNATELIIAYLHTADKIATPKDRSYLWLISLVKILELAPPDFSSSHLAVPLKVATNFMLNNRENENILRAGIRLFEYASGQRFFHEVSLPSYLFYMIWIPLLLIIWLQNLSISNKFSLSCSSVFLIGLMFILLIRVRSILNNNQLQKAVSNAISWHESSSPKKVG